MGFKVEPKIEVNCVAVASIVEAFRLLPELAYRILAKHGLGSLRPDGRYVSAPGEWHPVGPVMAAIDEVSRTVGRYKMFEVGKLIPKKAILPPNITDIVTMFRSVDVAYHLNHRKSGQPMFDPATGTMLEGIGHYGFEMTPGERRIISLCENPYPCDFDHGLMTTFAQRFERHAHVDHVNTQPCRKDGASSCTYEITW
jgi:hypothetical protein